MVKKTLLVTDDTIDYVDPRPKIWETDRILKVSRFDWYRNTELIKEAIKDPKRIREAYVYLGGGKDGLESELLNYLARNEIDTKVLFCRCSKEEDKEAAKEVGASIMSCECDGDETLGRIYMEEMYGFLL